MKARLILVSLGLVALTLLSFGLQAQERSTTQGDKDKIIESEQQRARQFAEFQNALLTLKQRLARGTPEERERAKVLEKVLDECKNLAINQEFTKMLEILRGAKLTTTEGSANASEQSAILTDKLRILLDLMQNSKSDLSDGRKKLQEIIKKLQDAIDDQNQVRARTERSVTDAPELAKNQEATTKKTDDVKNDIDKYLDKDKKDGKAGEAANLKGENKEGKGDGAKGEAKDAGKQKNSENAKGETKDGGKESKEAKGEAKPGEDKGNPKADAKAGDKGQEGSPKADAKKNDKTDAKGSEGAAKENKPGQKSDKGAEGSAKDSGNKDPMKKDGPQGTAKSGDDKKPDGDKKPGPDSQAKSGGDKPQVSGPKTPPDGGNAKGGDAKGGDAKGGEGDKQGDAKSGDSKDGQGSAKDGGGPAPGSGDPKKDAPQASQKGDGGPPPPPPPPGAKKDDDVVQSAKKIKEAGYDQKIAEDKIKKNQNDQAAKVQGDAIKKMEEAKKKLEKLLQQMREEEIERVLAALQARCEKMLIMQMDVLAGTEDLDKSIQKNVDAKPTQGNKLASLKLSDKEKDIVQEANKCIDILEAEGSAVAFPEVFQQIRQDMIHVQKRLEITDAADVTQGIEKDIIATLKEMIDALKKARDDNQDPAKPGPPGKSKSGKPGDQKLLELLQELKMVRSLQKRINDRTTVYGKQFPGEQANETQVVRELRNLGERQLRIQEIVANIAKGANK